MTIDQAAGQADPTGTAPIHFTVVFSEAVTGFAAGDVTLSGTAGATTAGVTGSGAVYDVAVSGMTSAGTVLATIAAGVAFNAAGNSNVASTSSDNTVAYGTAGPSGLVSDDFNSSQLDTGVWTFVNPLGDASYSMSGSQVRLSVPGGQSHDIWTEGIQAPRIMQSAADTDFALEVKFDSVVSQRYQLQGLLVEQDSGKFLRVDQYSDGSQTRLYVARFTNGAPTVQYNVVIPPSTGSFYLRLAREGDHWMESYSYDGLTWSGAADFTWALSVHAVGVYAGNAGPHPSFTGIVDYFHDRSNAGGEDLKVVINQAADQWDPTDSSPINFTVTFDRPVADFTTGDVVLTGTAGASTAIVTGGGATYNVAVSGMTSAGTVVASIPEGVAHDAGGDLNLASWSIDNVVIYGAQGTSGPAIEVWYGSDQEFGRLGIPQRWVNILGNVHDPDGVASLAYSLNGGDIEPLSMGGDFHDNPRLQEPGDFNIDVAYSSLAAGTNTIRILAIDATGDWTMEAVTVNYVTGQTWSMPYEIDWSQVTNIQDVGQIVDGHWVLEGDGVRSANMGYDRLIAVGDTSWQDYEVVVPITVHNFDATRGTPGVGLLLRWDGHHDWGGDQPLLGWYPMGMLGWYTWVNGGRLQMDAGPTLYHGSGFTLDLDTPYVFKMRVETTEQGHVYSLKVWRASEPEPSDWGMIRTESLLDYDSGSFLLVAHYVDASFGTVSVVPIGEGPLVQDLAVNDSLLSDADAGVDAFSVTVVFDASMDPTVAPVLSFGPDHQGTLVNGSGSWSQTSLAHDTYTMTYDVSDQSVSIADIRIERLGSEGCHRPYSSQLYAHGGIQYRYGQSHGQHRSGRGSGGSDRYRSDPLHGGLQ